MAKMPISRTGNNRAFTLVELIVVIVVVVVLAMLTAPPMLGAMHSAKLRTSTRDLLIAARYARDFAATRRRTCRLSIDIEQGSYRLEYQSDPEHEPQLFKLLSSGPVKPGQLPQPLRFESLDIQPSAPHDVAAPSDAVHFYATGGADAAVVRITDGKRTWSLMISPGDGTAVLTDQPVTQPPNDRKDLDA
jgi:prepilin-type N-terminal cleavage/methylation domain-containing protein